MFWGEYYHSVDDKGRVIIPQRFRNELGTTFVITRGIGKCLFIFRQRDFEQIEETLAKQPRLDQHSLRLKRWFFAGAAETSVDNQGRVAIPMNLRDFAGISDDAVIAGTSDKIEVWSRVSWDALNDSLSDDDIVESAFEVGLGRSVVGTAGGV